MRFIIITRDKVEHRHVVARLLQSLSDSVAAIFVETHLSKRSLLQKIKLNKKRYGILIFLERVITKCLRLILNEDKQLSDAFFGSLGKAPKVSQYPQAVSVISANTKESLEKIKSIKPDFILIYGTGIIKESVLSCAKYGAFNMHTGISPHYRGSDCIFWPLYLEDYKHAGATVHSCTKDIDGGGIFRTQPIHLTPEDNQHTAFAKSVAVGADMYQELVEKLIREETVELKKQSLDTGREFKFTDRTFFHDFYMLFITKTGILGKRIARYHQQQVNNND